jgi:hypothetical protein
MMAYITNAEISNKFFEGETVPGDNTIDAARNTDYIDTTTDIINMILWRTTDVIDTYKVAKRYALILYGRLLENENEDFNPVDPDQFNDKWWHQQLVRKYGKPALVSRNPSIDWRPPSRQQGS